MLVVAKPSTSSFLLNPSYSLDPLPVIDYRRNSLFCPITISSSCKNPRRNYSLISLSSSSPKFLSFSRNCPPWLTGRRRRVASSSYIALCSPNDAVSEESPPPLNFENPPQDVNGSDNEGGGVEKLEELELLGKPLPKPVVVESETESDKGAVSEPQQKPDKEEALAPFLKFFKPRDAEGKIVEGEGEGEGEGEEAAEEKAESDDVGEADEPNKFLEVEYYEPKPGDLVVGVVVYGNENKLDVNIGADLLATMLTKEVLPLYDKEMEYLLCDLEEANAAVEFMDNGKMGLIRNEEALGDNHPPAAGRPVVEAGTVLFAEVLGRTLSGRPLLSSRRFFRRIAWHRVRQIQQLNEPIQVRITEWNTGGLLTRIEGLRAFLPKAELTTRVNSFTELKENVGRQMYVQISRINEETNDLILSERQAWENFYLREGTLVEGTVNKIFSFGAQIRLGDSNRSGLLHMSNISRGEVTSVSDLLSVGEKVKVLVLRSLFPNKISLGIAELESEPGLFISDKERVFAEAEVMARKYRQNLPPISTTRKPLPPLPAEALPYQDESSLYANWAWFKFQGED